jgi:HD-GYP domain-containing protein (c-di-GMP phosphodiesterase class II)
MPQLQKFALFDNPLPFAITDLEGKELLPSGTRLDEETVRFIAEQGSQKQYESKSLLKYGSTRSDLEFFISAEPYAFIFGGPSGIRAYLERISEVLVPLPILSALNDFKENEFYTYRHSLIVFALTSFMMEKSLPLRPLEKNALMVGPTHDLGKRFIPRNILNKGTPLTLKERSILEFHTIAGYILLSYYLGDPNHPAARVAFNHHERRNGSGYPRGILNTDHLVEMVATCDVYDALISPRPYRMENYDNRTALEELFHIAEQGELDLFCVKMLVGRNRSGHPDPKQVKISREMRGTPPANNCYSLIAEEED